MDRMVLTAKNTGAAAWQTTLNQGVSPSRRYGIETVKLDATEQGRLLRAVRFSARAAD